MGKEYIEKESMIQYLQDSFCKDCDSYNGVLCRSCRMDDALTAIDSYSTADVAPVVHGQWIVPRFLAFHVCSICSNDAPYDDEGTEMLAPYCPNCGAKMDLEEDHAQA